MQERTIEKGDHMNVGIMGGGSIGLLLAAYLGKFEHITVFVRTEKQAAAIEKNGILLLSEKGERLVNVRAGSGTNGLSGQDFIFIAVKQYHLEDVMPVIRALPKQIPVCFLQNGMGHLEWLETLPNETVYVGTVEHGAKRIDMRTVKHNGIGKINIAVYRGSQNGFQTFPAGGDPDFPFQFHRSYQNMLAEKLMANAVINPLTVVFRSPNGALIDNPCCFRLFRDMFDEIYELFPFGNKEKAFQKVVNICQNTKDNTSSMLKDIQDGRRTEIDAILGYVIRVAREKNIRLKTVPVIYTIVKGMEQERS
jgi:2-dehydropantoate 2-reductase